MSTTERRRERHLRWTVMVTERWTTRPFTSPGHCSPCLTTILCLTFLVRDAFGHPLSTPSSESFIERQYSKGSETYENPYVRRHYMANEYFDELSGDGPLEEWGRSNTPHVITSSIVPDVRHKRTTASVNPDALRTPLPSSFPTLESETIGVDEDLSRTSVPYLGPSSLLNTFIFHPFSSAEIVEASLSTPEFQNTIRPDRAISSYLQSSRYSFSEDGSGGGDAIRPNTASYELMTQKPGLGLVPSFTYREGDPTLAHSRSVQYDSVMTSTGDITLMSFSDHITLPQLESFKVIRPTLASRPYHDNVQTERFVAQSLSSMDASSSVYLPETPTTESTHVQLSSIERSEVTPEPGVDRSERDEPEVSTTENKAFTGLTSTVDAELSSLTDTPLMTIDSHEDVKTQISTRSDQPEDTTTAPPTTPCYSKSTTAKDSETSEEVGRSTVTKPDFVTTKTQPEVVLTTTEDVTSLGPGKVLNGGVTPSEETSTISKQTDSRDTSSTVETGGTDPLSAEVPTSLPVTAPSESTTSGYGQDRRTTLSMNVTEVIANTSVTTEVIGNASVTTEVFGNASVTTEVIGNASFTTVVIGNTSFTTEVIGNTSFTTEVFGNTSITTEVLPLSSSKGTTTLGSRTSSLGFDTITESTDGRNVTESDHPVYTTSGAISEATTNASCDPTDGSCAPRTQPTQPDLGSLSTTEFGSKVTDRTSSSGAVVTEVESSAGPSTRPTPPALTSSSTQKIHRPDEATPQTTVTPDVVNTLSSSPGSLIGPSDDTPKDEKKYWIRTVLEADPDLLPDNFTQLMEQRLSVAYHFAFLWQNSSGVEPESRRKRSSQEDSIEVKLLRYTADKRLKQVELLYTVEQNGHLVLASVASFYFLLLRTQDLYDTLGYHLVVRAEPYVRDGERIVADTSWVTYALIGGLGGGVVFLICCLWIYCRSCHGKSVSVGDEELEDARYTYGQRNRQQVFQEGGLRLHVEGKPEEKGPKSGRGKDSGEPQRPLPELPKQDGTEKPTDGKRSSKRPKKRSDRQDEKLVTSETQTEGWDNPAFVDDTASDETSASTLLRTKSSKRRSPRKPLGFSTPGDPFQDNTDLQNIPGEFFDYVPSSPTLPLPRPTADKSVSVSIASRVPSDDPGGLTPAPHGDSGRTSSPAVSRAETTNSDSSKVALLAGEADFLAGDTLSDTDADAAETEIQLGKMRRRISELLDDAFALAGPRRVYSSLRSKKVSPAISAFPRWTSFRAPGYRARSAHARVGAAKSADPLPDVTNMGPQLRPLSADYRQDGIAISLPAHQQPPEQPKVVWSIYQTGDEIGRICTTQDPQILGIPYFRPITTPYADSPRGIVPSNGASSRIRSRTSFPPSSSLPMLDTLHEMSPTRTLHAGGFTSEVDLFRHGPSRPEVPEDDYDEIDIISALKTREPVEAVIQAIKDELRKFNSSLPGSNQESYA